MSMKVKMGGSPYRGLFCLIFALAFLLPFLFFTTSIKREHFGRKWETEFPGQYYNHEKDSRHLYRLLLQAQSEILPEGMEVPRSFEELVTEVSLNRFDSKTTVSKLKAMVDLLGQKARVAKLEEAFYKHFASIGIPKGVHCLTLKLTMEYSSNARARKDLISPLFIDNNLHHFVVVTDNVLAASVVVSSTIRNAWNPSKIVFHVITDEDTYSAMHAWFSLQNLTPAIVEVKGVHQFGYFARDHMPLLEALTSHAHILQHYHGEPQHHHHDHDEDDNMNETPRLLARKLNARSPKYISIMNHLRIYLPELFPDLKKIIFLDDDVVVQRDLSGLFKIDMEGKVNGAVETCRGGDPRVMSKRFREYFNFSHPLIAQNFDPENCPWAYGMNVFDLEAWRKSNITDIYHHWIMENIKLNLTLWSLGTLPPALIAFYGKVHPIDSSWHMLGLGYQPKSDIESIKRAAVIHYNGDAKPWLEVAYPEMKPFWSKFVNYSNEFIRQCNILEA